MSSRRVGSPAVDRLLETAPPMPAGWYGVIFSKYDLSCALELHDALECPGYSQEDAVRISLNIVLYSMFPN